MEKIKTQNYIIGIGLFFFVGILLNYKPAYDYTLIKNLTGFLFCFFITIDYLLKKKEFYFSGNIYLPIFFFSWLLISSFYAPFKFEAGKHLENYILYFLIFITTSNLEIDEKIFYIWITTGIIASITAIFQFYGPRHYAISTFGNPNFYAGHIIMVICISISNLLDRKLYRKEPYGNLLKYLDFACVFLGIWGVIITNSRAAIVALLFGISVIWYFYNFEKDGFVKYLGLYIILGILVVLFPKILLWYKNNIRYYMWMGTLKMISKKPLFGWGLGNFIFFYPYFKIREYFLMPEATPVTTHPHNEYLEIWAETGLIGLFLFISLILFFIVGAVRNKEKDRTFLPGVLGGIISVLFDNIFSTNLRNPSTAMYFWFLLGTLSQYLKKEKINFKFSKNLWYLILSVSLILSAFHFSYRILPQIYFKNGEKWKEWGVYEESIKNYFIACNINPYNYECWYKLAYVYGLINQYKKSKEIYLYINNYLFPHFAKIDSNLGTVYMKLGNAKKALEYYKVAEWFNPYDEDVLCSIASIYLIYYNNIEEALKYINRILKINPENAYAKRILFLLKQEGKIKKWRE